MTQDHPSKHEEPQEGQVHEQSARDKDEARSEQPSSRPHDDPPQYDCFMRVIRR
jgi:hypothetical protein